MSPADAKLLIATLSPLCKAEGIRRVKVGDVEIEFGGATVDPAKLKEFAAFMEQGVPTDDEVLFHSAPGYIPEKPEEPPAPKTARGRRATS